ncbi:MAG: metallophosphoesterase family protein [Nanoarchaeota archaeon]|nr:metallophosphoesterase family protein [Nanoarchaeota archaeon]MCG2717975.1 metallophosphoesterase [Nanoarchaeota archaeon]
MDRIKIIDIADIHSDYDSLSKVADYARNTEHDIVLVRGDIIEGVFSERVAEIFVNLNNGYRERKIGFLQIMHHNGADKSLLERIAEDEIGYLELCNIRDDPQMDLKVRNFAKQFAEFKSEYDEANKKLIESAKESMIKQYEKVKEIMEGLEYLTLPGNHDGKCLEDVMGERNLHGKVKEVKGFKFGGFGGSTVYPGAIPKELLVLYDEGIARDSEGDLVKFSELYSKMPEESEIIIAHEMPQTYLHPENSFGLTDFMVNNEKSLALVGHMHKEAGVHSLNGESIIINPGSLGEQDIFAEISICRKDGKPTPEFISFKRINEDKVETFVEGKLDDYKKPSKGLFSYRILE